MMNWRTVGLRHSGTNSVVFRLTIGRRVGTLDSAPLPNGCCISERRKQGYAGLRDAQPRTCRGPIREAQIEAGGHVSYIGANSVPIVKRLLNQLAYPLGVSARSASPIATERRISLSLRDPPAPLDTFPPSPDAELSRPRKPRRDCARSSRGSSSGGSRPRTGRPFGDWSSKVRLGWAKRGPVVR